MRAKYVNEKFSEAGDPIKDMGIGIFVRKSYKEPAFAARKMYINLEAILGMDEIPDDIIYPIEYKDLQTGSRIAYNPKYIRKITNFLYQYVDNDNDFKSDVLRELNKILLMAGYPKTEE